MASPRDDFFDRSDYYTGPPLTAAMVADAERLLGYVRYRRRTCSCCG